MRAQRSEAAAQIPRVAGVVQAIKRPRHEFGVWVAEHGKLRQQKKKPSGVLFMA